MELEDILKLGFFGVALINMGGAIYLTYKISGSMQKVKESTTILLDSFTEYLTPRIRTQEEMESFRELAETRERYKI